MQTEIKYPVIPEDPGKKFNLIWKNISFVVKKKTSQNYLKRFLGLDKFEYVRILNGVNGIVQSGTLMAIMGPSGSGKTTLLATLSRRIKGEIEGEILLNGKSISKEEMIKISGFVPQQDLAIESLTVQEHMEFMACMKMDRRYRAGLRKLRISVLLTELTLINCANSKLSALSGGEKKRVSLAVQLLTEPSILFCDEPTTGLDSYTAMTVLNTLHDVSKRGKIVICSIHQPTSGLFEIFHWLLLISAGRVAFQGSIIDATNFFDSLNLHCPQTYNNAEFYVSQLSENDEDKSSKKVKWICDRYKESIYAEKVSSSIRDYHGYVKEANNFPIIFSDNVLSKHDFKKIRTLTQIEWLLWRTYIDYKRNLSSIFLRFIIYLFIGIFISLPYVNVTEKVDQNSIQNIQGLMYLTVVETSFTFNYNSFYTFPRELPLLLYDIAANLYNPTSYYISKILIMIPSTIIQPFLYAGIIYLITGLKGGLFGFIYFVIPIVSCAFTSSAFGLLMSTPFDSIDKASLISVPIDFIFLLFSGIFLHIGNLLPLISWMRYLSIFYYALEAVSLVQWGQYDHIECLPDPEIPCISTGLEVLDKYGYINDHYYIDLLGLLLIFLLSHFANFLVFRYRSQKEPVY
ncbi:protein scarlet-like isoform X1 [Vespula pensylvanica]|uniref:protein scarlet-like isoform X1 n=1 Tax=Vespula pensylvanica TaxID=30213 RepID=UPI001CB9E81D|nr:protein scarlet-like isoform X1 [Vespula pensylvanica]XP_043678278.1 protein scarlet-like isoform X1 [Vespula pensylvanica]